MATTTETRGDFLKQAPAAGRSSRPGRRSHASAGGCGACWGRHSRTRARLPCRTARNGKSVRDAAGQENAGLLLRGEVARLAGHSSRPKSRMPARRTRLW